MNTTTYAVGDKVLAKPGTVNLPHPFVLLKVVEVNADGTYAVSDSADVGDNVIDSAVPGANLHFPA